MWSNLSELSFSLTSLRSNNALHPTPPAPAPVRGGRLCYAGVAGELWR